MGLCIGEAGLLPRKSASFKSLTLCVLGVTVRAVSRSAPCTHFKASPSRFE